MWYVCIALCVVLARSLGLSTTETVYTTTLYYDPQAFYYN